MSNFSKKAAVTGGASGFLAGWNRFETILGKIIMVCYHMRKIVMAVPVVLAALQLAAYNTTHLPDKVGLFLQNNGTFTQMIDKGLAVTGPVILTGACLFLMLFSRKAMYAWFISIFTLALPILLLVSNIYPA